MPHGDSRPLAKVLSCSGCRAIASSTDEGSIEADAAPVAAESTRHAVARRPRRRAGDAGSHRRSRRERARGIVIPVPCKTVSIPREGYQRSASARANADPPRGNDYAATRSGACRRFSSQRRLLQRAQLDQQGRHVRHGDAPECVAVDTRITVNQSISRSDNEAPRHTRTGRANSVRHMRCRSATRALTSARCRISLMLNGSHVENQRLAIGGTHQISCSARPLYVRCSETA